MLATSLPRTYRRLLLAIFLSLTNISPATLPLAISSPVRIRQTYSLQPYDKIWVLNTYSTDVAACMSIILHKPEYFAYTARNCFPVYLHPFSIQTMEPVFLQNDKSTFILQFMGSHMIMERSPLQMYGRIQLLIAYSALTEKCRTMGHVSLKNSTYVPRNLFCDYMATCL